MVFYPPLHFALIPQGCSGFEFRCIVSDIKAVTLVLYLHPVLYLPLLPKHRGNSSNCLWSAGITGIPPPREPPGCTLGLNLNYAGVSLLTVQVLAKQSTTDCFMVKHLSLIAFDAIGLTDKKCPQAVLACLPMSLSVSAAEQLTYLSRWICTALRLTSEPLPAIFQRAIRDKKYPFTF